MHKYVMHRLLLVIPVLMLSSLVVFGLMRVMPGDALTALMAESGNVSPRELQKLRKDLGLDRPIPTRERQNNTVFETNIEVYDREICASSDRKAA
jgi:peptide/nickel transport system permease protein